MVLKLYYNSSEEDVTKISIDLKNEAKSIASFDVSRIDNDNWIGPTRNMQFKIIQIYDDTTLKFEGLITTISPQKTLLHCECEDICSILANNVQIQSKIGGTDFIRYEGKIGVVSDEIISVGTSDGELLGMGDDEVIGKYIIISDANIGDTTVALFNTDKTYIGFGQVSSNLQYISGQDYTDVDENPNSSMGDPWTLWKDDEHLTGYGGIQLSVVNHSISSTSTLKQMIVDIGFDIEIPFSGIFPKANVYFDVIMKKSNTPTDGVLLWRSPTYTQKVLAAVKVSHSLNITVNIAGMPALDTQLFTKDVLWETSYIFIKIVSTEIICKATAKWKYVGIDLTYTDTAYSQTNDEITDNTTVFINAKDSNDVAINFTERGVSAGDSFCIAESVPHVYDLVGNGSLGIKFLYGKSYPENIKKGFGKCLNGVNSFELWQEITSYMDHTWYVDYRIYVSPILVAKDRTALESETADLTGFASYNIIIEDQEYSEVIIFGTGGDVVSVPTTSTTSIIPYKEIRKDYISLTELTEYATKLATKFSDPAYSIELIYNGFKDVQVGYSVASITIPNDYGDDSVYTNQIVRRVVYEQDTINSLIITKVYLGRGMTPIDEKVGNILGTLKKRLDRNDAISSSRLYIPATAVQHSDLSGILPSTASQYHFTSTQYTKLVSMLSGTFKAANIQKYSALSNSPRVYDGLDFMGSDNATRQKIYNLANGTDQYDGVNFGQLDAVKTTADAAAVALVDAAKYQKVEDVGNFKNQYADAWGTTVGVTPPGWTESGVTSAIQSSYLYHDYPVLCTTTGSGTNLLYKSFDEIVNGFYSFWVYPTATNVGMAVYIGNGTNIYAAFLFYTDGKIWIRNAAGTAYTTLNILYTTNWYHCMIEFNQNGLVYYYLDGALIATITTTTNNPITRFTTRCDSTYTWYIDAEYEGTSWLKAWSSMYDGHVADMARWTRYGERGYHSLEFLDLALDNYYGQTTTNGGYVILDLVNGTSTETNVTQLEVSWVAKIPPTCKTVELKMMAAATVAHTSNFVQIIRNGITKTSKQAIRVRCGGVANYYMINNGKVAVDKDGKIKVYVALDVPSAPTITFYVTIMGYEL